MSDYLIENDKTISINFNSMAELMKFKPTHNQSNIKQCREGSHGKNWLGKGNRIGNDVIRKAMYGDTNLLKVLTKMNNDMEVTENISTTENVIKARKRKARWSDIGDELDIHKVYSGSLDKAWRRMKHIEQDKIHHHIVLMVNIGCRGYVDQTETLWRAAVTVKIANTLISAGKSVKIIVGTSAAKVLQGDNRILTTTITVKEYNEPLAMERLASMTHAGFHRTMSFMARCMAKKKVNYDMGSSNDWIRDNKPLHIAEEGEGVRYVYIGQCESKQDAVDELKRIKDNWEK